MISKLERSKDNEYISDVKRENSVEILFFYIVTNRTTIVKQIMPRVQYGKVVYCDTSFCHEKLAKKIAD